MAGGILYAPEIVYLPKTNRNCFDIVKVAGVLQDGKQEIDVQPDGQTAGA